MCFYLLSTAQGALDNTDDSSCYPQKFKSMTHKLIFTCFLLVYSVNTLWLSQRQCMKENSIFYQIFESHRTNGD